MADSDKQESSGSTPVYRARKILIVGCGELGASLAVMLSDSGNLVKVLDKNHQAFRLLPRERIEAARVVPVLGDGCSERDLRRASAHESDILVACTGSQTINLMTVQIAKSIIQIPKVLCVLNDAEVADIFGKLGIETVVSRKIIVDQLFEKAMA